MLTNRCAGRFFEENLITKGSLVLRVLNNYPIFNYKSLSKYVHN